MIADIMWLFCCGRYLGIRPKNLGAYNAFLYVIQKNAVDVVHTYIQLRGMWSDTKWFCSNQIIFLNYILSSSSYVYLVWLVAPICSHYSAIIINLT